MKKVLLGMSSGVDSSVSLLLLQKEGYEVIGTTFILTSNEEENIKMIEETKKLCSKFNIPHLVYNFKEEFKESVENYFINSYEKGETPNPCVVCNRDIKFKMLYNKAKELNIDYIATGHYANVKKSSKYNSKVIAKSKSLKKDQTYFLYNIDKEIINKCIFPLGRFKTKEEIRKIARDNNIPSHSKSDSQDICFINNQDYISYLKDNNVKNKYGKFIDSSNNIIGDHKGIINYTVGQRKRLGLSRSNPTYVLKIKDNDVVVGNEEELYTDIVNVKDLNFLVDIKDERNFKSKIRYRSKEANSTIIEINENNCIVKFEEKQRAVTKGQSIVFYDNDELIGGGIIN